MRASEKSGKAGPQQGRPAGKQKSLTTRNERSRFRGKAEQKEEGHAVHCSESWGALRNAQRLMCTRYRHMCAPPGSGPDRQGKEKKAHCRLERE